MRALPSVPGAAAETRLAPAGLSWLGLSGAVWHGILVALALALLTWILARRIALLTRCAPERRLDRLGERLRSLLVYGFGQARQPRERLAGTLHIVLFAGFLALLLRSLTLLGEGFVPGFTLPGLGGAAGEGYRAIAGWAAAAVLAAVLVAAARRAIWRPARYHDRHRAGGHGAEAYLILALIATLMVADACFEGAALAAGGARSAALPLASLAAALLDGAAPATLDSVRLAGFWVHEVALLAFACYLPVSKHFHVITALPNTFLAKLPPRGRVREARPSAEDGALGVGRLEDFTWKQVLDFYSCTDCGRCSAACPAYATGTPLSPRMISVKCRDEAYRDFPVFGRTRPFEERRRLLGEVIRPEELWACTTCAACEETCPVLIEYVDKIVDLRRRLVEEGEVPRTLHKALADISKRGNPYGQPRKKRAAWMGQAEGVRLLAPGEEAELLWFADSATAYDPRIEQVGRALGCTLAAAGLECGALGADESDSGHEVRRFGEEGLFEQLRERNRAALAGRRFERVLTCDPHAFNALRNDYQLEQPIVHHTQLLDELVRAGRLRLGPLADGRTYTFHDPCYLGRHNGEYDAPRRVLAAIPLLRTVEMERSRNRSACCGGGSLQLFLETECERRMGEVRLDMAEKAGADVVVTACPFCLIQLEDALKTSGRAERMEVLDLAELVDRARAATADRPEALATGEGEKG